MTEPLSLDVLMISTDRSLFNEGSDVRIRMQDYGSIVTELHIVVFSRSAHDLVGRKIAPNVWIYPTASLSRAFYVQDAQRIGGEILSNLKKNEHKIIITTQDPFETGLVGVLLAKKDKIPLLVQVHTDVLSPYFSKTILNRLRVRLAKYVLKRAGRVRVVSERIKKSLAGRGYVSENLMTVLPVFVDAKKIKDTEASFTLMNKYPAFSKFIVMVSRLEPEKNISCALQAFSMISKDNPSTALVMVGEGSERSRIEREILSLGLQKSVIFEGWQNDRISYFKTGTIFLTTSQYEGYGMTLVEAVLSGIPIVTTDVGVVGEILTNGVTASVCPVGDVLSISEKLRELLGNDDLRALYRKNQNELLWQFGERNAYLNAHKKLFLSLI